MALSDIRSIQAGTELGSALGTPIARGMELAYRRQQQLEDAARQRGETLSDRDALQQRQDELARATLMLEAATKPELGIIPTGASFEDVPGLGRVGLPPVSQLTLESEKTLPPGAELTGLGMLPKGVTLLGKTGFGVDPDLAAKVRKQQADEILQNKLKEIEAKGKMYAGKPMIDENGYIVNVDPRASTSTKVTDSATGEPVKGRQTGMTASQEFTPQEIVGLVNIFKQTGTYPPGLSRNPTAQKAFYAVMGGQDGEEILRAGISNKAVRAGQSAALKTQEVMFLANKTALGTLDKQLEMVNELSRVIPTDTPFLNKYAMHFKNKFMGDPDTAAYINLIKTAAYEFAKIISGASASIAGVTVSSAEDAEAMLNEAMSRGQLKTVMGYMKREADARLTSQQESIDYQRGRLMDTGKSPPTSDGSASQSSPKKDPLGLFK